MSLGLTFALLWKWLWFQTSWLPLSWILLILAFIICMWTRIHPGFWSSLELQIYFISYRSELNGINIPTVIILTFIYQHFTVIGSLKNVSFHKVLYVVQILSLCIFIHFMQQYNKVATFVCQPRGTADEYVLKCTIKIHLPVKTVISCRSPIFPVTE